MTDSYDADLYELLHRGTPGDIKSYAACLRGSESVLELGCGYGRVLQSLLRRLPELDLWGIDIHPGLLAEAKSRLPQVQLRQADMRSFEFDRTFDAVIVPYSGLWNLPSKDDVKACFRQVYHHLKPGGKLLFDVYTLDTSAELGPESVEELLIAEVHAADIGYRVYETSNWEVRNDVVEAHVRYRYQPVEGGEPRFGSIRHYYHGIEWVQLGLRELGFVTVELQNQAIGRLGDDEERHVFGSAIRPPDVQAMT